MVQFSKIPFMTRDKGLLGSRLNVLFCLRAGCHASRVYHIKDECVETKAFHLAAQN